MESSPFAKLPRELRDTIFEFVVNEDTAKMFRNLERCNSDDRYLNTLAWLTSRHPVLATCRQLRDECVSSYLVSNALIEPQSFFRISKRSSTRRRLDEEYSISAFPSSYKHWGKYPYTRLQLIEFLAGLGKERLHSVRDVGLSLLSECTDWIDNAYIVPLLIEDVATYCVHLKTTVAEPFSIPNERLTISIGYHCSSRPTPAPLELRLWLFPEIYASGPIYITIAIDREDISYANFEKAIAILQKREEEKTSQIRRTISGPHRLSNDSVTNRETGLFRTYFDTRRQCFTQWLQLLRFVHYALVEIVQHAWHHGNVKLYEHLLKLRAQGGGSNLITEQFLQSVLSALRKPDSPQSNNAIQS